MINKNVFCVALTIVIIKANDTAAAKHAIL